MKITKIWNWAVLNWKLCKFQAYTNLNTWFFFTVDNKKKLDLHAAFYISYTGSNFLKVCRYKFLPTSKSTYQLCQIDVNKGQPLHVILR